MKGDTFMETSPVADSARPAWAAIVGTALRGAVYPLRRTQLIHIARENDASRGFVMRLVRLPEIIFESEGELVSGLLAQPEEGAGA